MFQLKEFTSLAKPTVAALVASGIIVTTGRTAMVIACVGYLTLEINDTSCKKNTLSDLYIFS